MNRRNFLRSGVASPALLLVSSFSTQARAVAPPALIALAGVAITVAFRRYVVGALMKKLAILFPRFFATELRRYLMAVAVALGISNAHAAIVAEKAEDAGAQDLARNGVWRVADVKIENSLDTPLELARLHLLLVDVASKTIELKSSTSWGLVVAPGSSMNREIVARTFPNTGLKQWYLADEKRTLAVSKPFMVVA
jgi:hypothetical protein